MSKQAIKYKPNLPWYPGWYIGTRLVSIRASASAAAWLDHSKSKTYLYKVYTKKRRLIILASLILRTWRLFSSSQRRFLWKDGIVRLLCSFTISSKTREKGDLEILTLQRFLLTYWEEIDWHSWCRCRNVLVTNVIVHMQWLTQRIPLHLSAWGVCQIVSWIQTGARRHACRCAWLTLQAFTFFKWLENIFQLVTLSFQCHTIHEQRNKH